MAFPYNYPMGGSSRPPPAPPAEPLTYNVSPKPQTGVGAVGMVPGNIGIPPSRYEAAQSIYPGLGDLTGGAGRVVQNELRGELSPETIATIQDEAARFGLASGLPLTNFAGNRGLRSLGLNIEGRQRQGAQDYLSLLGGLAGTANDPALLAEIAAWNATMNAAPNPSQATNSQLAAYWNALRQAGSFGRTPTAPIGQSWSDVESWSNQNRQAEAEQLARRQADYNAYWNPAAGTGAFAGGGDGMSLDDWYGITYGDWGPDFMEWDMEGGY